MNVDTEIERHVRRVLSSVATTTPVPAPPELPVEQRPRHGRRWARVVAPVAVAAATVAAVLAVGAGDDDGTAVRTGPSATTDGDPTATGRPDAGADTVPLGDTPFRVPREVEGFDPAGVWDRRLAEAVDGGVTYSVPGPLEGMASGTLSLSVRSDPELHAALVAGDVGAVVQHVYQDDLAARFVEAGPWHVLEVDRTGVVPGVDAGQADRVYQDWLFAAGPAQVVQVTSDTLAGPELLAFVARVEGPPPTP